MIPTNTPDDNILPWYLIVIFGAIAVIAAPVLLMIAIVNYLKRKS